MKNINPNTKLSELTVEEFLTLQLGKPKRYEYGIKGIAKIFGCSRNHALKIKNSGSIDGAVFQNGKTIVVDVEQALILFNESGK